MKNSTDRMLLVSSGIHLVAAVLLGLAGFGATESELVSRLGYWLSGAGWSLSGILFLKWIR